MKRRTKKLALTALSILFGASLTLGTACSISDLFGGEKQTISLADGKTEYVVDYGEWFNIPTATAENGEKVVYSVVDEAGKDVKLYGNRFKPSIGSFTVTYSAEGYDDVTVTVKCKDDSAPVLTLDKFVYGAVSGDVMEIPTFFLEDPSGVNYDKTKIAVYYGEQRTPVTITDGTYIVDNAGVYSVEVYIEDMLGNSATVVNQLTVSGAFIDPTLDDTSLMDFDEVGYENIIYPALGYDAVPMEIVTENLPQDENGNASTGGMLKFSLAEDSETKLFFNGFKKIHASDDLVDQIVFRYYSDKLLARFTVYGPDGQTMLLNRRYRTAGWWEFSFSPKMVSGWDSTFEDFYLHVECEDAVTVYLDEVYYTESWEDENLQENQIANFDDEGYLSLVTQNKYTVSAKYDIVQAEEIEDETVREGINGGALKVSLDENLAGYRVNFQAPIDLKSISSITIRMYMDRGFNNSRWGWVADNGNLSVETWGNNVVSMAYHTGWWEYTFPAYHILRQCSSVGSTYIAGFYFGYYETNSFAATLYVDEISYQTSYEGEDYGVENEDYAGKTLFDFTDEQYALNVSTVVAKEKPSYQIASVDGAQMLQYNGISSTYDNGLAFVLPETLSLLDTTGALKVGNIYMMMYYPDDMTANIKFAVEGNNSYCYSTTYMSVSQGYHVYGFSASDLIKSGIFDVRALLALMKSGNTCYVKAIWYDEVVAGREAEYGKTLTIDGENCTVLTEFANTDKYFARALLSGYSELSETNEKVVKFSGEKSAVEYRLNSLSLKRGENRTGNELVITGSSNAAIDGLVVGVKLADGSYVTETISVEAGEWSVSFYLEGLLEVSETLNGIVIGANGATADVTLKNAYLTPVKARLATPTLSIKRTGETVKVSWKAVDGASEYNVLLNGEKTVVTGTEFTLTESGKLSVQAVSESSESLPATTYAEVSYMAYNDVMDGYTLVGFDNENVMTNVGQVATQCGSYTHNIAESEFAFANDYENEFTSAPIDALQMTTTANSWVQEGGWGGFTYTFAESLKASTIGRLGISVVHATAGDSRYACHYFGIVANGKAYNLMSKDKSYVTSAEVDNTDAFYSEELPVGNWQEYFADLNKARVVFYLDIKSFLAENPEIEKIDGVYMGVYKSRTIYVDEIFYQLYTLDAPTIALTYENGVTKYTVTGDTSATLEVCVNGEKQTVSGNTFTATVSGNTEITAQNVSTVDGVADSAIAKKYVADKFMKEIDGKVMIEDFATAASLLNVSDESGIPFERWEPMVKSTVSYIDVASNAYASLTGGLKVEARAKAWAQWAGATYYFPVSVAANDYGRLALKVVYPNWTDSQWQRQFVGLVIDGKLTYINMKQYVTGARYYGSSGLGDEIAAEYSWYFWDASYGGTNCLGIEIYIDIQKYLADHPTITNIDGVYIGTSSDASGALKTWYVDEIYFEKLTLAEPTITYARENDVLTATITGATGGQLTVNGQKVTSPYKLTITTDTVINAQSVSENEQVLSSGKISVYVPAAYLKTTDKTVMLEDFSGFGSTANLGQVLKQPGTYTHAIANSSFVHNSTISGTTFPTGSVQIKQTATAWQSWGGFSYSFLEGISAGTINQIAFKITYDNNWGSSTWEVLYTGLRVGNTVKTYAQSSYMSFATVGSDGTISAATYADENDYWSDDLQRLSSNTLIVYIDVAKLVEANELTADTVLSGFYFGGYRSNTYYLDEIFYTLK